MHAEYWSVGASRSVPLSMSQADISKHLVVDWVPSLAMAVGPSFMAWPHHLIGNVGVNGVDYLAIHRDAGRSDRQWKSVLSWMLGVAGARQVLEHEGYRWIAPASAFYPDVRHPVDATKLPTELDDMTLALPFLTTFDPPASSEGTLDPLGLYQIADEIGSSDARVNPDVVGVRDAAGADRSRGDIRGWHRSTTTPRRDRSTAARSRSDVAGCRVAV